MHRTNWPAWSVIAARLLALVIGLIVLALIGRVAAAHSSSVPPLQSDAGELAAAGGPVIDAGDPPRPQPATPAPTPPAVPPAPAARASVDDPVFVNYASAEQLRRLPGIGAKRADAIVALRGRLGRFQRVEDLLRVKGIGRATLRKLRPLVRLDVPEGGAQ